MSEVDGPVEIELDPTPSPRRGSRSAPGRGGRGRRRGRGRGGGRADGTDLGAPGPADPDVCLPLPSPGGHGSVTTQATPTVPVPGSSSPPPSGRTALVVAGAAVLLLTGFLIGRSEDGSGEPDATAAGETSVPTATPRPTPPPTTRPEVDRSLVTLPSAQPPRAGASPTTERAPTTTTTTVPPLRLVEMGGPLLPSSTGLMVVGLTTEGDLAEVDLDRGVARFVDIPDLPAHQAANSGYAYVGVTSAVVGTWERQIPYVVPADGEPVQMPTSLSRSGSVMIAGPGPNLFWMQLESGPPDYPFVMALADVVTGEVVGAPVDHDGLRTGRLFPTSMMGATGTESVLIGAVGGTYGITAEAVRRVTDGVVVGIGDGHLLAVECDEQLRCATLLIADDGTRTVTPVTAVSIGAPWMPSSISPDGSMLAVRNDGGLRGGITLIDLVTGEEEHIAVRESPDNMYPATPWAVWSADSRSLVFLAGRRLSYYDRERHEVVEIGDDLPSLVTFGARPATPGTGTEMAPPARR